MDIVLATGNPGKIRELNQLLDTSLLKVRSQAEFGTPEVPETGTTFVENAIIKARNAARHTGLPAIADDSGLEVDALNGAPGIYSARYAGDGASDADNSARLLAELADIPDTERTARFQCVLVYMRHADDPTPQICQGTWEGLITHEPAGDNGFGYDPVFLVPSRQCTAAQLPAEVKNAISHRGQALRLLLSHLQNLYASPLEQAKPPSAP